MVYVPILHSVHGPVGGYHRNPFPSIDTFVSKVIEHLCKSRMIRPGQKWYSDLLRLGDIGTFFGGEIEFEFLDISIGRFGELIFRCRRGGWCLVLWLIGSLGLISGLGLAPCGCLGLCMVGCLGLISGLGLGPCGPSSSSFRSANVL